MGMAAIDDIDTVILKHGGEGFAHINFRPLSVGIVILAFGVGGVVKNDNGPILGVSTQVVYQPVAHGIALCRIAIGQLGIEADDVHVAVVEGVILFGPACDAISLKPVCPVRSRMTLRRKLSRETG